MIYLTKCAFHPGSVKPIWLVQKIKHRKKVLQSSKEIKNKIKVKALITCIILLFHPAVHQIAFIASGFLTLSY